MHIALATQSVVESEGAGEVVVRIAHLCQFQIIAEQRSVVRVSTVLDDEVSTFQRSLSAEVCNTLFCDNDVHVVL